MVHATVAIADGVLLQADPGSRLIIDRGACIGAGSILHASQGILELGSGVTIGDHVLVVGSGKIGANACIGSHSTLVDASIDEGEMVASKSFVTSSTWDVDQGKPGVSASLTGDADADPKAIDEPSSLENGNHGQRSPVYGRDSVNRLMRMMFPYRSNHQSDLNSSNHDLNGDR